MLTKMKDEKIMYKLSHTPHINTLTKILITIHARIVQDTPKYKCYASIKVENILNFFYEVLILNLISPDITETNIVHFKNKTKCYPKLLIHKLI